MRNIATRNVLLLIGTSAFVLMAATGLALVKEASARARVEITKSGRYYYARDWKRPHRAYRVSRRLGWPRGHARVYIPGSYPRPPISYESELLLDCLMTQPFVICP
jgi:hypothetical protein